MSNNQFVQAIKPLAPYTKAEDILSSSFHGIGIALSIAGTAILVTFAALYADAWAIVSSAIFGASMIFLYSSSTIYHAVRSDNLKKRLKKLDHIAIYYLIAGTYTPFMLVNLRGALGWSVFGVIWALAILGTILKICKPVNGAKKWSVGLYLGMGWLIVIALKPLIEAIPSIGAPVKRTAQRHRARIFIALFFIGNDLRFHFFRIYMSHADRRFADHFIAKHQKRRQDEND